MGCWIQVGGAAVLVGALAAFRPQSGTTMMAPMRDALRNSGGRDDVEGREAAAGSARGEEARFVQPSQRASPHRVAALSEYAGRELRPPYRADWDRDGVLTVADVAMFMAEWGSGVSRADVNLDGGVNGEDFARFQAWFTHADVQDVLEC